MTTDARTSSSAGSEATHRSGLLAAHPWAAVVLLMLLLVLAAMVYIAIGNTTTLAYLPLTIACLHSLVPAAMRAQVSAVMMFCAGVFGGLGPLFVGMISDALT